MNKPECVYNHSPNGGQEADSEKVCILVGRFL